MIHNISPLVYVPFLILNTCATVIASQAMISGMFSIVYQGMSRHLIIRILWFLAVLIVFLAIISFLV
jgi:K+ transporter